MKPVWEMQILSVSEKKTDPSNPTVDTRDIYSLSHSWAPRKDTAYPSITIHV